MRETLPQEQRVGGEGAWQPAPGLPLLLRRQQGEQGGGVLVGCELARWLANQVALWCQLESTCNLSLLVSREEWGPLSFTDTRDCFLCWQICHQYWAQFKVKSFQMLVDWPNDECKHDAALIINTKINSRLSANIEFMVSLFPPCCVECPGAVFLGRKVRVCEDVLWSLSFHPDLVSFPLDSLIALNPFKNVKAPERDSPSLLQALECPARTLWAFNKLADEFQLVDRYKKQLWFPERKKICDCWSLLSFTLYCLLSVALDNRLPCFVFYSQIS